MPMNLVTLVVRVGEPEVGKLLAYALGMPSPERLAQVGERYRKAGWRLLGLEEDGRLIGLIGLECAELGRATIQHIVVVPERRRQGIGRALLFQAAATRGIHCLVAETDADAVDFYRRCGFSVESLGETYPGVERFRCTWESC
jgi:ribosomal protein S18 acetylase RimI-like enzyme